MGSLLTQLELGQFHVKQKAMSVMSRWSLSLREGPSTLLVVGVLHYLFRLSTVRCVRVVRAQSTPEIGAVVSRETEVALMLSECV